MTIRINSTDRRIPIDIWADDFGQIDSKTIDQASQVAELPFAFHHVALMPDYHMGYGMPIGGVLAADGFVVPNAVGVDIGCGMMAAPFNVKANELSREVLRDISDRIKEVIPTGKNRHAHTNYSQMPSFNDGGYPFIAEYGVGLASESLGTLGGGNHFIELQKDEEGYLWLMIHSGSRNLGHYVATAYNKLAVDQNKIWNVYKNNDLAYLPVASQEGKNYISEMNYCVEYAKMNRQVMLYVVANILQDFLGRDCLLGSPINIAHNYAALENHYGRNVWIHRKGATKAQEGTLGIIPGSQGTASYIVDGKGSIESFHSCSHGAGRVYGRKKAKEELDIDFEQARMGDIVHDMRSANRLDEAPSAYKDIDDVMRRQEDLVQIKHKLTPIMVVKG